MSAAAWEEANRQYLAARIALVRDRLASHAALQRGANATATMLPSEPLLAMAAQAMPGEPAVERVRAGFGLSPFEAELLVLCAGAEIDAEVRALCAAIEGAPERAHATFGVALAALPDAHWSALHPSAALRYWKLIDVRGGEPLTSSALRIDERVLHYLFGVSSRDPRLAGLIGDGPAATELVPLHDEVTARIAAALTHGNDLSRTSVIVLCGEESVAMAAVAAAAAARAGMRLSVLRAADVPAAAAEREQLARLWEREAVLENAALFVDVGDGESGAAAALADAVGGVVFVAAREPVALARRAALRFDVGRSTPAEQRLLWTAALGADGARLGDTVEQIAAHFTLPLATIRSAARQALAADDAAAALWEACRIESRARLDSLAQRLEPRAVWHDLVLPDAQIDVLHDVAAHVRRRHTVYEQWGFGARGQRDLGITALFAGASGTGKTLAAEIIANELQLDLYRIDLSQMVSKYIGETEKNLRRVFEAGEDGGAILLFDEADALFGRRSEVRDSHDRYANIEVSYLLQRMEAYRGLAVLTTNLKNAIDPAFLRRIRFVVNFPFPDADQRARIWTRIFPAGAPCAELDVQKLARLNVAGGNIRNIAVHAAFLAAEEGGPIRMRHLARAAQGECAKLEKPLTDSLGGWT